MGRGKGFLAVAEFARIHPIAAHLKLRRVQLRGAAGSQWRRANGSGLPVEKALERRLEALL